MDKFDQICLLENELETLDAEQDYMEERLTAIRERMNIINNIVQQLKELN